MPRKPPLSLWGREKGCKGRGWGEGEGTTLMRARVGVRIEDQGPGANDTLGSGNNGQDWWTHEGPK